MRLQLSLLCLTVLQPPSFCVGASRTTQVENWFELYLNYHAYDASWTETWHRAHASLTSLDRTPERLQHRLKGLFSEKTSTLFRFFETVVNCTVSWRVALHDGLALASQENLLSSDVSLTPVLNTIATLVAIARDDLRARFPLPAMAPGHIQREKYVSDALEYLQQLVVRPEKNNEIEQEILARVKPFLHDVGVLIGDVAELYPEVIEALLSLSAVLWPEAAVVRSLVILYCFGPYVLGKDVISGWLFEHVSETLKAWQMQIVSGS